MEHPLVQVALLFDGQLLFASSRGEGPICSKGCHFSQVKLECEKYVNISGSMNLLVQLVIFSIMFYATEKS